MIGELTAAVMLIFHTIGVMKLALTASRPGDIDERVDVTKSESWSRNFLSRILIPESTVLPGKSIERS